MAHVRAVGLVSPVGLDAPSSCAAIRCGLSAFEETSFRLAGEKLLAATVPFGDGLRGREKLLHMASTALRECLGRAGGEAPPDTALLLCLAEPARAGRFDGLDETFLRDLRAAAGLAPDPAATSRVIAAGRVGGAVALARAGELVARGAACLVVGVDTLVTGPALAALDRAGRLLRKGNVDGLLPGEAAGALLLAPPRGRRGGLAVLGVGFGAEPAPVGSGRPLRADGMAAAVKAAFAAAGAGWERIDYRLADVSGEQYRFKELSLALARTMRVRKPELGLWHPSECVGEVGAAVGPVLLAVAAAAGEKRYAPGPGALALLGSDDGERAAVVCRYEPARS